MTAGTPNRFFGLAVVLGLISAIGPFAIDMYLPALTSIGATLHASQASVQMTLNIYFIVVGACQLIYGPLSDMFGRKRPIYVGLVLFIIGSIGCAFSTNVEMLIAFRGLQAFGACAGTSLPRAIVRDLHTGVAATKLMSMLMLVFSISPILAPLVGSVIIDHFTWRGVFWAVTLAAGIALLLAIFALKETRPAESRVGSSWKGSFVSYGGLLKDRHYLGLVFTGTFGISCFFVYLSNASFIIQDHFHLSARAFAICFAINAIGFFGAAQFNGYLAQRFGQAKVVKAATSGVAAVMVTLFGLTLAGVDSLPVMVAFLFVAYGFLGLVVPNSAVLAMEKHGPIAGSAAALMGAIQMMTGAVIMAVVSHFADATPLPMITGITVCALTSFTIGQLSLRKPRKVSAA
jgi:DHA1 family bicyclomycin/chloramphenicol resistance-like MFS transporter